MEWRSARDTFANAIHTVDPVCGQPQAIQEIMMSTLEAQAPIIVTYEGGARFAAQVRSHRVIVDQPPRGGGEDSAPMPIELLGVALGTCVALYVQRFCQSRDLPHEGLYVEVDQVRAVNPNRIGRFDVRVTLAHELPEQHAAALKRVVQSCPVHNTLTEGADVRAFIEAPRSVAIVK